MKRRFVFACIALYASFLFLFNFSNHAFAFEIKIYGHYIKIENKYPVGRELYISNNKIFADDIVKIDIINEVRGVLVLVGKSGPSGNICDPSHFVISIPRGQLPNIDGPIETCGTQFVGLDDNGIRFAKRPTPNAPGRAWIWTSEGGIRLLVETTFQADFRTGWQEARQRTFRHPV